jgi:hypothetical protein
LLDPEAKDKIKGSFGKKQLSSDLDILLKKNSNQEKFDFIKQSISNIPKEDIKVTKFLAKKKQELSHLKKETTSDHFKALVKVLENKIDLMIKEAKDAKCKEYQEKIKQNGGVMKKMKENCINLASKGKNMSSKILNQGIEQLKNIKKSKSEALISKVSGVQWKLFNALNVLEGSDKQPLKQLQDNHKKLSDGLNQYQLKIEEIKGSEEFEELKKFDYNFKSKSGQNIISNVSKLLCKESTYEPTQDDAINTLKHPDPDSDPYICRIEEDIDDLTEKCKAAMDKKVEMLSDEMMKVFYKDVESVTEDEVNKVNTNFNEFKAILPENMEAELIQFRKKYEQQSEKDTKSLLELNEKLSKMDNLVKKYKDQLLENINPDGVKSKFSNLAETFCILDPKKSKAHKDISEKFIKLNNQYNLLQAIEKKLGCDELKYCGIIEEHTEKVEQLKNNHMTWKKDSPGNLPIIKSLQQQIEEIKDSFNKQKKSFQEGLQKQYDAEFVNYHPNEKSSMFEITICKKRNKFDKEFKGFFNNLPVTKGLEDEIQKVKSNLEKSEKDLGIRSAMIKKQNNDYACSMNKYKDQLKVTTEYLQSKDFSKNNLLRKCKN